MGADKKEFLSRKLVALLHQVPTEKQPLWGKMTLQQTVEHLSDAFRVASGRAGELRIITPEDRLEKYQQFLMSDTPFKENTINPLMPEVPAPVRKPSVEEALQELQAEIDHFFAVFEANEHLVTLNPIFGELNFQMNLHLLYKHALHHLKQFGVEAEALSHS